MITISNAATRDILVTFADTEAVRRTKAREKGFGLGADVGGGANVEVRLWDHNLVPSSTLVPPTSSCMLWKVRHFSAVQLY